MEALPEVCKLMHMTTKSVCGRTNDSKKTYLDRMCIRSSSMLDSTGPYSGPGLIDAGERDGPGAGSQTKESVFIEWSTQ